MIVTPFPPHPWYYSFAYPFPGPSSSQLAILKSPKTLFQSEANRKAIDMKMIFILMQIKLTFTKKVLHLASFWKWEFLELVIGLFKTLYLRWRNNFDSTAYSSQCHSA